MENLIRETKDEKYFPTITTLRKKYEILANNLDLIKPKYKVKRGWIDGLGTVIKTITGNMDNNDCIEINKQIEALKFNQHDFNNEMRRQIEINEKMAERFNTITQHINKQQENLEEYILGFQNKIENLSQMFYTNQYFNQLIYDMDLLNEHLKEISESIILAKLNIISKHILHPKELNYIQNIFRDQTIELTSKENIYELLELQAYYNASNIIFVINIPNFYPDIFSSYHLKELPINSTYTINLESPFLLINEYIHQYIDKPCPVIEGMAYCKENKLRKNEIDECMPNILNNKEAHCKLIEQPIQEEILLLEPSYLLLIAEKETPMKSTCEDVKTKTLRGISLIHFSNCTVTIQNIQYTSTSVMFWDSIKIISTLYNKINHTEISKKPSFNKLTNWTMENIRAIQLLDIQTRDSRTIVYSWTGLLTIAIIICIIFKYFKPFTTRETNQQENQPEVIIHTMGNTPAVIQNPSLMWPSLHSLHSREGGVTS